MKSLAGLDDTNIFDNLNVLTIEYENWINNEKGKIKNIDKNLQNAAIINIKKCEKCLLSIREGIEFIKNDTTALKAFKLTNEAILFQQIRGNIKKKTFEEMKDGYELPNFENFDSSKIGKWDHFR